MMTEREACEILQIGIDADEETIKRKFRRLMAAVHPDTDAEGNAGEALGVTARELNEARDVLMKRKGAETRENKTGREYKSARERHAGKGQHTTGSQHTCDNRTGGNRSEARDEESTGVWRAPINTQAFCPRTILHTAEDEDGNAIGTFSIARGKYLWTPEEEFPLFLKSLFGCAMKLLEEVDARLDRMVYEPLRVPYLGELTLLLAGQFIDAGAMLARLSKVETDENGRQTFCVRAMLERTDGGSVPAGSLLRPRVMREHRLYLADASGKECGFLSFEDDRLYYVVIPLLEQKRIQVRIEAGAVKRFRLKTAQQLELRIRYPEEAYTALPEDLNARIRELLEKYENAEAV